MFENKASIHFSLKMRLIFLFFIIFLAFTVISGSFVNPYPRFSSFNDGGNPGDALYLTKYIENGDIETVHFLKSHFFQSSIYRQKIKIVLYEFQARDLALVDHPDIPIENYAGYFTVNKEYNSNSFFWFFPAKVDSDNAPVVLWLQGSDQKYFFLFLTPFLRTCVQ